MQIQYPVNIERSLMVLVFAGVLLLVAYKVAYLGFDLGTLLPEKGYEVSLHVSLQAEGPPAGLAMYLPESDDRQQVSSAVYSGPVAFSTREHPHGLLGLWYTNENQETVDITYAFHVQSRRVVYEVPQDLSIPDVYPKELDSYLRPIPEQGDHTEPLRAAHALLFPLPPSLSADSIPSHTVLPVLRTLFEYAARYSPSPRPAPGKPASAFPPGVFASELMHNDATHMDRPLLFAALARHAHIPSRIAGGLILTHFPADPEHKWVELYIDGRWVPFDVEYGHFATLPDNYLTLYRGNTDVITHTAESKALLRIESHEELVSTNFLSIAEHVTSPFLNPFPLWQIYLSSGVPLISLKILLLIPVAAMIVAFFRNVIGLETYGVFLPALIATSGLHTGLLPALCGFLLVTLLVALLHIPLEKWGLLYVPKLALMLLAVVGILLGTSFLSYHMGWEDYLQLSLLPLVILAVSAERLSQHLKEEGFVKAFYVMGMTVFVISSCFLIIHLTATQWLILTFPELLILVALANLGMGRWLGLRLSEHLRFKWLVDRTPQKALREQVRNEILGINRRNGDVVHKANKRRDFVYANDKYVSKKLLERHRIPIPPTIAAFSEIGTLKKAWNHLSRYEEFVIKPARGRKGHNILVLRKHADHWITPGGRRYNAPALQKHIADIIFGSHANGQRDTALIEYRVHPHPFFDRIYEGGLPDLRVITHHGAIIQAMLRIPTDASDGKANLHQGALGIGIDLETGKLKRGFCDKQYMDFHPDSGKAFRGITLPYWSHILAISRRTARLLPLQYLGIDLVIDRARGPLVLEVNARPGLQIQTINEQGLRPLLELQHQTQRHA